ncbi:DUF3459 domain-containing protein, partial [bacterium]
FNFIRKLIAVRKSAPALVRGGFAWVQLGENPALAAYVRESGEQSVLALHNLSDRPQPFTMSLPRPGIVKDLLDGESLPVDGVLRLTLAPYGFRWLELP